MQITLFNDTSTLSFKPTISYLKIVFYFQNCAFEIEAQFLLFSPVAID